MVLFNERVGGGQKKGEGSTVCCIIFVCEPCELLSIQNKK